MTQEQGRRVAAPDEITQPGDYSFDHGILWAWLPTGGDHDKIRLPAKGHNEPGKPEWDITDNPDGTVTVDPSIKRMAVTSMGLPEWHGHLVQGTWTD